MSQQMPDVNGLVSAAIAYALGQTREQVDAEYAARRSHMNDHDWCTCEHSYGSHEFGLCQVVIGEYGPARPKLCPCHDPRWDDD